MDKILTQAIWRIRKRIKPTAQTPVTLIYTSGNTYQLYFSTIGCKFACIMCNYGFCDVFSREEIEEKLDKIIENFPQNARVIVLEASGSFLDEREISKDLRRSIFEKIATVKQLKSVIIETHYSTVTTEIMQEIKELFFGTNIQIEFEFGVESTNEDVLRIYNKNMNLQELNRVIWEADSYGISCELNFLTGAPLLTAREQIQDTLSSISWVMENCPPSTMCVLFPINIKKDTLIWKLWKNGKYNLIYHWEFITMLAKIPEEYLDRIFIAWWGNRSNYYDGKEAIKHPYSCDDCHDYVQKFYEDFYVADKEGKIQLLKEIMIIKCKCRNEFLELLKSEKSSCTIAERFNRFKEWVKSNFDE